jgi:O-antigen/teichoic acid export membrane protein
MSEAPSPAPASRPAERFVSNVIWSWIGVAVQLLPGFVVTPYLIIKLGAERYGIWSTVFSLVGYYALVDLGFRSAAVRYAAHYRALGEDENINELVNTLFVYFSAAALALTGLTLWIWQRADRFFQVPASHHGEFTGLVLMAGLNLSAGIVGGVFTGCVEGFHRFDVSNRIFIVTFGARSVGWFALLAAGYGLVALGAWALIVNVALVILYMWAFYRMFPSLRLSPRRATMRMFRTTFSYGIHTVFATLAARAMEQITIPLISHYRTMADGGFYNFPLRLLQYGTDAVTRVGMVATPQTADMAARRELGQIARLAIFASRYCLVLFMPVTLFLGMYGYEVLAVWLRKSDVAVYGAPLLPAMLVGFTLAQAAQFCSSSILFGLGAQRPYAVTLVIELALNVAGTVLVLPRYGILGVAVVTSGLMLVSRGIVTPWLLCRHLRFPYGEYMLRILAKPILVSAPLWAVLAAMRRAGITGRNVPELAGIGIGITVVYFGACYFTCVAPEHKALLLGWLAKKLHRAT